MKSLLKQPATSWYRCLIKFMKYISQLYALFS
jgi:hypothetical protein